ncbi:hypothetical protein ABTX81_01800 [Kitasatospora sp. NPDC097605]|uniref:hypothetical protein n=1 Tax=Kitasatospora sp. NPDC097605 TaxID=3157226 RepID=UPI0033202CDD
MPAHIEALHQIHRTVVALTSSLSASHPPGKEPDPAGLALRDAALGLAEADQHLHALHRTNRFDHSTSTTYSADPSAHHLALRRSELALDRSATGLHMAAGRAASPARSSLRAGAARVRSALARRPGPARVQRAESAPAAAVVPAAQIRASR